MGKRIVLNKKYFKITKQEFKDCCKLMNSLGIFELQEKYGVQPSFSSEGGIAIPYIKMGLNDFGEMLHLRFYKGWDRVDIDFEGFNMQFVTNANKPIRKWTKEEKKVVFEHAEKMLVAMQKILQELRKKTEKGLKEVE